jgi:hypothetical protein
MVDNIRVQPSEAGAVIEIDTEEGTLIKVYKTLPLAGTAAFELSLIPYERERMLQVSGAIGCGWHRDHVDIKALKTAGFRLVIRNARNAITLRQSKSRAAAARGWSISARTARMLDFGPSWVLRTGRPRSRSHRAPAEPAAFMGTQPTLVRAE